MPVSESRLRSSVFVSRGMTNSQEEEDFLFNTDEEIGTSDRQIPIYVVPQCLSNLKNKYVFSQNVQNLLKHST